jgi:hypothetical protein
MKRGDYVIYSKDGRIYKIVNIEGHNLLVRTLDIEIGGTSDFKAFWELEFFFELHSSYELRKKVERCLNL